VRRSRGIRKRGQQVLREPSTWPQSKQLAEFSGGPTGQNMRSVREKKWLRSQGKRSSSRISQVILVTEKRYGGRRQEGGRHKGNRL